MMYAMSSGVGTESAVWGWLSTGASPTSMTGSSHASRRDLRSDVVTATIGAASATMNWMRASGSAGSTGT